MTEVQDAAPTAKQQHQARPAVVAGASVLGAIAASSCCIVPLVLFSLGVSGAWLGNLTALAPYQPIFVTVTVGSLVGGFWMVYRKPKVACAEGAHCARPVPRRIVELALWSATALVIVAVAFPFVAPALLGN